VQWHGGALSRLTLLDFGLAAGSDFSATRSGVVPGTPAYMAPELLAGAPPTPASDLYALGVCLFQLLAGRLPHDAPTLGALLLSVTRDDAPALRSIEPAVGEGVSSLVAGLLARAPGQRPARAAEVATRLERERGRALPPAPDVTTMSVLPRQPP
jgi:serine/threonine-protein kinase